MTKKPPIAIAVWFGLAGLFAALAWQNGREADSNGGVFTPNRSAGATFPVSIDRATQRIDARSFVGPTRPLEADHVPSTTDSRPPSDHWAFQPLVSPSFNSKQAQHPVDALLFTRSDSVSSPSHLLPIADARTLMRRLSFDTVGLPPTYDEIQALKNGETAWTEVVDDVLSRPQFGERWARHWLDVARYADSNGYEYDEVRWNAYPYRDWVIRAINEDLPFDDFVRWQIAGDELLADENSERSADALTATGFLTAGPHNTFFPQEIERYDELDDIVNTIGQTFLGLSVGCARCHDHKTEPISQVEYYRLIAAFQSTSRADRYLTPDAGANYLAETADLRAAEDRAREFLEVAARDVKIDELDEDQFSEQDKELLKAEIDPSNEYQAELLRDAGTRLRVYAADTEDIEPRDEHLDEYTELVDSIDELSLQAPAAPETTLAIQGSEVAPCWLLEGGDVEWKGDKITPGFLSCVGHASRQPHAWRSWDRSTENPNNVKPRSALAQWLTDVHDGAGALVARVAVNRIWQHYFGHGLVNTPNNFGHSGDRTQHEELIGFLASELVDHDWSMKHIHRLIVTSHTYRQTTNTNRSINPNSLLASHHATAVSAVPATNEVDEIKDVDQPKAHTFLVASYESRQPSIPIYPLSPRRLDAEAVRDAIYAVSGQLNLDLYGPPIQPPIPNAAVFKAGEQDGDTWPSDAIDGPENWRRSLYIQHRRSNPVPLLALLGKPEAGVSCSARPTAVVPTQTLALWNEPWLYRQASDLAGDLVSTTTQPIQAAYKRILQRAPTAREYISAESLVAETNLTTLTHALMLSNEFLYVD